MKMPPDKAIYLIFLIFLSYFLILTIYYFILAIIALFEGRKRFQQHTAEDYGRLYASTFTLPVSVIIPAHNEEEWVLDSLKSVLNLEYPEFEVIVVDDGSGDRTLEILNDALELKSVDRSYVEHFQSGRIREVFKSQIYPNVSVVAKFSGYKKAGAVNAGLNLAKYKYVCVLDADTILEPDALIKVMAHVQKDPDNIIGIGAYFGLLNGFKIKDGRVLERNFTRTWLVAYQNLEYIRSFVVHRTAWSKFNAMPIIAGGFAIWRRDIFLELGGYAPEFSSEDVEFTFRAHDYMIEEQRKGYKIMTLPYYVGWTEGPSNIISFIRQRNRWQRVINEAIWKYRHMILSPRHKAFALFTLPYYLFYEALGVFFEITSILLIVWGFAMRALNIETFLAFFSLMVLSHAVISLLSLFIFTHDQKLFSLRDISYFVVISFLEFFCYRWLITISKVSGTLSYCLGIRTHDRYERFERSL